MSQSKIYVGNLSYDTDENSLRELFESHGAISDLRLIKDHATGRSKGFAFITFEQTEAATAAVEIDGTEIDGRRLKVSMAREDNARRGTGTGGSGRGGNGGRAGGEGRQRW